MPFADYRSLRSPLFCRTTFSSGYASIKKRLHSEPFENRGSQIVPRHVVPLHPFGAFLSSGSKTLSVRFAHRFFVEPRSHPAMQASKKGSIRSLFENRGSQIRTDDILLPKQTLYQAELHPVASPNIEKVLALESFALCRPDFPFCDFDRLIIFWEKEVL